MSTSNGSTSAGVAYPLTVHEGGAPYRTKGVTDERRWNIHQLRKAHEDERGNWALNFQTAASKRFDPATGIFARQLLFWADKGHDTEGWVYKTKEEFYEETGLTRRNQDTARRKLEGAGALEAKKKGVPGTMHYRLNLGVLSECLNPSYRVAEPAELVGADAPVQSGASERYRVAEPVELLHRVPQEGTPEVTSEESSLQEAAGSQKVAAPPHELYKNEVERKPRTKRPEFLTACNRTYAKRMGRAELAAKAMTNIGAPDDLREDYEAIAQEWLDAFGEG